MSFSNLIKKLSILAVLSLAVACASSPKVDDDSVTEAMAADAIQAATATIAEGNSIGADTSAAQALLDQANAAFAEGDYAKAFELANKAKTAADFALIERRSELAANDDGGSANTGYTSGSGTYQVVTGDSLWSIAGSSSGYGDPYQWPLIYKANKAQIKDADLIFPGQVFDIVSASASEVEAAIQHAKTRGSWSIGNVESSDSAYLAR